MWIRKQEYATAFYIYLSTVWNAHVAEIDSDLLTDLIIPTFSNHSTKKINMQKATEKATNNRKK